MTELQKKRYDIVKDNLKRYGIKINGKIVMSFHDMAWLINNHWDIKHFVTNEDKITKSHEMHGDYAIKTHQLNNIYRSIGHAVRDTEIESVGSGLLTRHLTVNKKDI